jgi:Ca2+-binding RTX toxin-like protein
MSTSKPKESGAAGSSDTLFALNEGDIASAKKKTPDEPLAPAPDVAPVPAAQNGDLLRGSLHQGSVTNHELRLDADEAFGAAAPDTGSAPGHADPARPNPHTGEESAPTQVASMGQASDADAAARLLSGAESAPQGSGSRGSGSSAGEARTAFATQSTEAPNSATPAATAGAARWGAADEEAADETAAPPTLGIAPATGDEDSAIPLDIRAALGDRDGSETLSIKISGVPAGAILSAGTDNGDGSWTLTPAQLQGLTITPPPNSDDDFVLTVTATSTEANGADTESVSADLPVTVNAVADAPNVGVGPAAGAEDTAIPLDVSASLNDFDGSESLSITFSNVPNGAVLSAGTLNADGTWTLTPAQLQGLTITPPPNSDGDFTVSITATTTEGENGDSFALTAQITVSVAAVADIPTLSVAPAIGAEDTAIALDIASALTDFDGSESLSITLSGMPAGAVLSAGTQNADGSWTLTQAQLQGLTVTPPANSDADFTLIVTATSTELENGDASSVSVTLPVSVVAVADAPILALGNVEFAPGSTVDFPINATLTDFDGSESMSVTISGLPTGAILSAGQLQSDGSWMLSQGELAGLKLTLPSGFRGEYPIDVTATSTESSNGDAETVTGQFKLTVDRDLQIVISHAVLPDGSQDTTDSYVMGEGTNTTVSVTGSELQIAGVASSAGVSTTYDGAGNVDIRVTSAWGSVRNVLIDDDQPRNITIRNFVDTDVKLGDGGPSTVSVIDAKGGSIVTGDGADTVTVVARSDSTGGALSNELEISTGAGDDVIRVTAASNRLTLPTIDAGDGADTIEILGTSADRVFGGAGDDRILTSGGNDIVDGGSGDNYIDAGSGNNEVTAGTGNDAIYTGAGSDTIDAGSGNDVISGGAGTDTAIYSSAIAGVSIDLGITSAQDTGGAGTDTLSGIENLVGSAFDDTLTGSSTINVLTGGAGMDILDGGAGNDSLIGGTGDDALIGGVGNDTIDGGADVDTASYATATAAVRVNLAVATAQNTGGAGTDRLVSIENLTGSNFNDVLTGNAADNLIAGGIGNDTIDGGAGKDTLLGGAGNDTLVGGSGDDDLDGGADIDTASYAAATAAVTVSLAATGAQNTGGAGNDRLTGTENLIGSAFNDLLTGDGANNVLSGGSGNDTIEGGAGDDRVDGGAGTDTASYATAGAGVTVSLARSTAQNTVGAGTDTLTAIENVTASDFNDVLTGSTGANVITGGAGDDTIEGGAGNDTLIGGSGIDTAGFASATAAVTVNLAIVAAQNTRGAGTDTLREIENLVGSGFNDILTGDGNANEITGGSGNDTIDGGAGDDALSGNTGNDTLTGGSGDDLIDGGTGTDTASYAAATSAVIVNLAVTGAQNTGGAGIDTLIAIENLTGSGFNDVLTGDANANTLGGGAGIDTLEGGGGNDVLAGGAGNDVLSGGAGNDTLDGGTQIDTASYATATAGVTVTLATTAAQNTGGAGTDRLTAIENLAGSSFNDTLTGNGSANVLTGGAGSDFVDGGAGNDTIAGGAGSDTLAGGAGNDTIDGGADIDTASYATATSAVTVNLATATAQNTGGGGRDTLTSIENLTGSNLNDRLTGDAGDNLLSGEAGNDTLRGAAGNDTLVGGAGNDTLDGGADIDTASYSTAGAGVTVSLAVTTAQNTGAAGTDTLTAVENLTGSRFGDTLTGDGNANMIVGGAGNDTLNGGAGNDWLGGGLGNDTAIGGTGSDVYLFEQSGGHDSFDGGSGWTDQISLSDVTGGPGSGGWTINLTSGSVTSSGSNQLALSADAAGTIQLADGSVLDFSGVETVTW